MNLIQRVFDIKDGTDYNGTAKRISDGIHIKGFNAWLMICSSLLASIGLDTNSTAIIIGAMLISPLMSTILGIGYSIGVHDLELFIRAVRNFAYVTFFSLITSVFYFLFTPLGQPTSEILSRTQPTLLDILVAFFGGVAGIVSGSRREGTNALPGVAIATALMPPLCASGYGLATGRWNIFGGAFYLFFLNTTFIAVSTYLMVKFLGFPFKTYVEKGKQKLVGRATLVVTILISIPSFLFLYSVYQKNRINQSIQNNIINEFRKKGNEILKWETEDQDSITLVKTFFSGAFVPDSQKLYYNSKLKELGLPKYRIRFYRMNFSKNEIDRMSTEMTNSIMKNIELQNAKLRDSVQQVYRNISEGVLYDEIKAFYPDISALGVNQVEMKNPAGTDTLWTAWIQWDTLSEKINKEEAMENIRRYLNKKLSTDTVWLQQTDQPRVR